MRAVVCSELGPADRLSVQELPDPQPGPGEIVIDVRAAGLNFPDTLIIQGRYQFRPDLPFVPGGEASGVVSVVGAGVERFAVGDEVVAMGVSGAFAEKWVVEASSVMPKPPSMEHRVAAGFGLTYGTSFYALKQRAELQARRIVARAGRRRRGRKCCGRTRRGDGSGGYRRGLDGRETGVRRRAGCRYEGSTTSPRTFGNVSRS